MLQFLSFVYGAAAVGKEGEYHTATATKEDEKKIEEAALCAVSSSACDHRSCEESFITAQQDDEDTTDSTTSSPPSLCNSERSSIDPSLEDDDITESTLSSPPSPCDRVSVFDSSPLTTPPKDQKCMKPRPPHLLIRPHSDTLPLGIHHLLDCIGFIPSLQDKDVLDGIDLYDAYKIYSRAYEFKLPEHDTKVRIDGKELASVAVGALVRLAANDGSRHYGLNEEKRLEVVKEVCLRVHATSSLPEDAEAGRLERLLGGLFEGIVSKTKQKAPTWKHDNTFDVTRLEKDLEEVKFFLLWTAAKNYETLNFAAKMYVAYIYPPERDMSSIWFRVENIQVDRGFREREKRVAEFQNNNYRTGRLKHYRWQEDEQSQLRDEKARQMRVKRREEARRLREAEVEREKKEEEERLEREWPRGIVPFQVDEFNLSERMKEASRQAIVEFDAFCLQQSLKVKGSNGLSPQKEKAKFLSEDWEQHTTFQLLLPSTVGAIYRLASQKCGGELRSYEALRGAWLTTLRRLRSGYRKPIPGEILTAKELFGILDEPVDTVAKLSAPAMRQYPRDLKMIKNFLAEVAWEKRSEPGGYETAKQQ